MQIQGGFINARTMGKAQPAPIKFGWHDNPDDYRVKSAGELMDEVLADPKLTDKQKVARIKSLRKIQEREIAKLEGKILFDEPDHSSGW